MLVLAKLGREADAVMEAEGWKWAQVFLDYPHSHGLRRTYPQAVELSAEDQAALDAVKGEFDSLTAQHESDEELPDEVDARFGELEAEIERLEAKRQAYDPADIARCGAFVILNHDGTVRIERGFVRAEDEKPEPHAHEVSGEGEGGDASDDDGGSGPNGAGDESLDGEDEDADDEKPLSDILIRDLTAHRTLGLRLALREQPEVAIVAVTHALSAQIFYRGADAHVLDIRPISTYLASHADGIEDTKAGKAWADHHARWAAQMPRDVSGLWTFVVELDHDSRMALFAHCAALTVNAVKLPTERRPRAMATADRLAEAVVARHDRALAADRAELFRSRHQAAHSRRRAGSRQHRGRRADGGHEEAGHGGSRRAVGGRNRLAARVDADAASRAGACRATAGGCCHGADPTRIPSPPSNRHGRDRSRGPGFHRATVEISAARRRARGQSHDAHALDGCIFKKARHFFAEALEKARCGRRP